MGCGCQEKKAYELPNEDCGCGCGPSCDCADCKAKWHGKKMSGLGTFMEYPRPKAAMFDPRQIMSEWPEPNDDPLIPYVRANEQGLPYEMLNQYKGRPNTLHGWPAGTISLNGLTELNLIKSATSNLLESLSIRDQSFVELDNETANYPSNNLRIPKSDKIVNNMQYRNVKNAPIMKSFFAFVPSIIKRGGDTVHEMYIRIGGPEAKSSYWDGDESELETLSSERSFISEMGDYLATYKNFAEIKTEGLRVLQNDYPIFFGAGATAPSKLFKVANDGGDYSISDNAYLFFGYKVMNQLVSQAWMQLSSVKASNSVKDDIKDILKLLMQACINLANVNDVAKGIAAAFTDRLKKDYLATELRAYYEYEVEVFGPNEYRQIDPKLRSVFNRKRADFAAAIEAMEDSLSTALIKVITANNKGFSDVLKALLNYDNIAAANNKIKELEGQVSQAQTSQSQSAAELQGLLQEVNGQLQAKALELEAKNKALSEADKTINNLQSKIEEKDKALKKEQEKAVALSDTQATGDKSSSKSTIIIGVGVLAAASAAYWYSTSKKR